MEGSVKYQYAPGAQSWGPDGTMQEESIDGEAEEGGLVRTLTAALHCDLDAFPVLNPPTAGRPLLGLPGHKGTAS